MFNYQNSVNEPAVEQVYSYFLQIVKEKNPHQVVLAFKGVFIEHCDEVPTDVIEVIRYILISRQESLFVNTLKRSCYILVNNWDANRHYSAIHELIELFRDNKIQQPTSSSLLQRLRTWLKNFVNSQDYQVLKLFTNKHEAVSNKQEHHSAWSQNYTAYLLTRQYTDRQNSLEQRQAAKTFAKKLKDKFKFDLAMYTAHLHSNGNENKPVNPTRLGNDVICLLEKIVAKPEPFSYKKLAQIFIQQNQQVRYESFKNGLKKYLFYSPLPQPKNLSNLQQAVEAKIDSLWTNEPETYLTNLMLRATCKNLINFLITEDWQTPSTFFGIVISEGHGLSLAIILLKIILICEECRGYLESAIAVLITYYQNYSESECFWFINFLEILTITLTIHAENVEYNLVRIPETWENSPTVLEMNRYRIFSQQKNPHQPAATLKPALKKIEAMGENIQCIL